ncbi:hypothetical protein [Aliivibrio fischeri]|uniref:hypothetical protein n=1 Tax=Aliivibrio fischeri TaxID=668 RepID=UPI000B1285DA|nr:hypothetical protein [Aliivibrio fischeri]
MNENIEQLLINISEKYIDVDCIKGGHNGPYIDPETPVRNTAHWLIVFSCLYKRTQEDKYKYSALKAFEYLSSAKARPMSGAFYCRKKKEKDFCNGVMGQAWVIEALLYMYSVFNNEEAYSLAEQVFLQHDFDWERSIWYRLSVDGSRLPFDNTFNHQLWFAAIGSLFDKSAVITEMCDLFFANIAVTPELYKNGVVYHSTSIYNFSIERKKGFKSFVDYSVYKIFTLKQKNRLYSKSVGYHGFNLYAYELLKKRYSNHDFYKSNKYKKMVEVVLDEDFNNELLRSSYSYPYNPPAFENGFALLQNGYNEKIVINMLHKHFSLTQDNDSYTGAVSKDKITSEARLYELVRILDLKNLTFKKPLDFKIDNINK